MTETIYQTKPNTCLTCVLAMIVGETEQYVLDWFEHQDPAFNDEDAIIFLAHHGIFFSLCGDFDGDDDFYPDMTIRIEFKLEGRCAYLVVESKTSPSGYHAIFWDGHKVCDPLKMNKGKKLWEYKISHIFPLQVTSERAKFFNLINPVRKSI